MLDIKTARCIKEAINNRIGISIAVEDVCKMQMQPSTTSNTQLPSEIDMFPTILGIQWGAWTILVWIEFNDSEIMVREVQKLEW